ncbi:MAG: cytochrome c3 family protein [bacterium]
MEKIQQACIHRVYSHPPGRSLHLWSFSIFSLFSFCIWLLPFLITGSLQVVYGQMVPNSAKECAICHFRWLDQFYVEGRGTDLVEYQEERVAASEMICYSCHNGILVDSRERFWAKRGHRVNMKPSEKVTIPPDMPLGKEGEVTCATCHTAHGLSDELRYQETIYLRSPNRNSEMCIRCHLGKDGGPQAGNHPLGVSTLPIPTRILDNYGRTGVKKDAVICETCHTVHGTTDKNLLVIPSKDGEEYTALLCESCHTANPSIRGLGPGSGTHPVNRPSRLKMPGKWNDDSPVIMNAAGQVICLTCHAPHEARQATSLLVKGARPPICLECHKQEQSITQTEHDLTLSAPAELDLTSKVGSQTGICAACHRPHNAEKYRLWSRPLSGLTGDAGSKMCESCHQARLCAQKKLAGTFSHPVGQDISRVAWPKQFPSYDEHGRPVEQGKIMCASCHNPHQWDPRTTEPGSGVMAEGDQTNSFLRLANDENSGLCLTCHQAQKTIVETDHDLRITAQEETNWLGQTCNRFGPCSACHVVHNAQGGHLWARLRPQSKDPLSASCESCHREKNCAGKKLVGTYTHPAGVDLSPLGNQTSLPLFDSRGNTRTQGKFVTCATCHNVHQWAPGQKGMGAGKNMEGDGKNSFLRIANDHESSLCLDCHKSQRYIDQTDHDLRLTAPKEQNLAGDEPKKSGLCGVCHLAHNGSSILMFARGLDSQGDLANQLCRSCHREKGCAEKKLISRYTHPMDKGIQAADGQTALPLYLPDGTKQSTGKVACATCHNPHQWSSLENLKGTGENREGTAGNSFLRLAMLPEPSLCEDCHQERCRIANTDHDLRLLAEAEKNILNQTVRESGICSACHLVHHARDESMWARELPYRAASLITRECASCHSQGNMAEKKMIADFSHPVDIRPAEKEVTTSLPLYTFTGEVGKSTEDLLTCSTCHNPHQWSCTQADSEAEEQARSPINQGLTRQNIVKNPEGDIQNSFLRLPEEKKKNLCIDCHKDKQYVCLSEHDLKFLSVTEPNLQGRTIEQSGVCSACHVVHNGPFRSLLWARQLPPEKDFMLATCLSCHDRGKCAEKKLAFVGLHPSSFVYTGKITQFRRMGTIDYQTYYPLYDKQGRKSPVGFVTCPTCHNVHQWDPKLKEYPAGESNIEGDPRNSFLRNSGAEFSICLDCHGFDAILRYKNYHVPSEWQPKYWRPGQRIEQGTN